MYFVGIVARKGATVLAPANYYRCCWYCDSSSSPGAGSRKFRGDSSEERWYPAPDWDPGFTLDRNELIRRTVVQLEDGGAINQLLKDPEIDELPQKRPKVSYRLSEKAMVKCLCSFENYRKLKLCEKHIYTANMTACKERKYTYTDPITNYTVFSTLYHVAVGQCCGLACRHCPFEHSAAPPELKANKHWNGAFYMVNYKGMENAAGCNS